ncbi:hypothetical protein AB0E83_09085 [Streptomyces sp. NPDC035033]|uniref:hypothetical protein n=1 Tax=Streptomyces sp. NPDC035033 TaxID=3155368 RepID=UPI0033C0F927
MTSTSSAHRFALLAAALAALAVACGTTPEPDRAAGGPVPATTTAAAPRAAGSSAAPGDPGALPDDSTPAAAPTANPSAPVPGEDVRGAFASLQATYYGSCDTDCASFLGRVHKELQELGMAMKADPKGPGHFPEPLARIAELEGTLAGDGSSENLTKHKKELIGARDFVNTWMQGHPDDYR